jgi:hypothetical protein
MTVKAIGNDENSRLGTIVKSTAAGTAAGYAMKWLWPVQKQEDTINKRAMMNYCLKITNKAKVQELNSMGVRTRAQDCFVKMIESGDKKAFWARSIAAKVEALGGENSNAGKEFRTIIRNVDEQAKQLIRRFAVSHNIMLKKIRPVVPFLVAGAGVGFFTGFTHNVMKND